jgi:peptide deformylase
MPIRKIATIGNPILRQNARAISREELATPKMQSFIDDLLETMFDANGAGIAANQVYEAVSVCAIHVKDNPRYPYKPNIPLTILANPEIELLTEETFLNYEGCLSVPNLRGEVPRAVHARVKAMDRHGNDLDFEVKGISAGTFQHEVDHLRGKLFVDRVVDTSSLCTWADFERFRMAEFVARAKAIVAKYGA